LGVVNLASTKSKLVLAGLGVVGFSVGLLLAFTHASFGIGGEVTYESAMLVALIIPLLVAPPAYTYVAWLSWNLKKAHDRMDLLAHQDALTGLKNRRAFVDEAAIRIGDGVPHVMVMIDIDHFKLINDRLGHAGGDNALKHTADVLRRSAPGGALIARLGGEEFGLLVPLAADNASAAMSAVETHVEGMRLQLNTLPLITPQGLIHVTASFGLAVTRAGEAFDLLLDRADKALYAAKDMGRNRLHAIV